MGAGQSDLYKGTYGDNEGNIPDFLKGTIKLPSNDSQLRHIFENRIIDGQEPLEEKMAEEVHDLAYAEVLKFNKSNEEREKDNDISAERKERQRAEHRSHRSYAPER